MALHVKTQSLAPYMKSILSPCKYYNLPVIKNHFLTSLASIVFLYYHFCNTIFDLCVFKGNLQEDGGYVFIHLYVSFSSIVPGK